MKTSKTTTTNAPMSLLQNVRFVFSALGKTYPKSRLLLPLYMACRIVGPFVEALIPSLTIRMITERNVRHFIAVLAAILLFVWGRQVAENIASMYLSHERLYTVKSFFVKFMRKVLHTDYMNIEPQPKQKLIHRASDAVYYSGNLISEATEFIVKFFGLALYGTAVFALDYRILLVTVVLFLFDYFLRRRAILYDIAHWDEHTEVMRKESYLEQNSLNISAGKDIRIYHLKDCFHAHFDELVAQEKAFWSKAFLNWYYPTLSDGVIGAVRDILAYGILIGKVVSGELDVAGFTLYLGLISSFTDWIYPLALCVHDLQKANMHFTQYHNFMNLPDAFLHNAGKEEKGETCHSAAPSIEFKDVSFCYENSDTPVLSHLNFKIKAGEKIALVGNNGAGKTTLVKLLCGLYPVTGGDILIEGKPLGAMDLDTWQEKISVVFQDAIPTAFSIAMNVAGQGAENLDRKKVEECLKRAGLWEKISELPKKEDTYITQELDENGILLSGGQMQKLLFARSIYKDGPMLILDEPTAALDPLAESAMYEEYHMLSGGKTSVFISHRLSSTKFCDRIFLLENGQITEMGTHQELMEKNGKYKEMFDIQSQYYKDETKREARI